MAIAHARPERFVTLTQVGNSWPDVRRRMKKLRHLVAREGHRWEWVWSVERNPKGTGFHVHCHQRGSFVRQATLSAMAAREGMGSVVDIRAWHDNGGRGTAYGLKAVTYTFKNATGDLDAGGFLADNGGRLTHQSRGWWTADGARDQEREAIREYLGDAADEWTVVVAGHASRWLAAYHQGATVGLPPV